MAKETVRRRRTTQKKRKAMIGKKSRAVKRVKNMGKNTRRKVMRKMRGGAIDDAANITDPNDFATYSLLNYAKKLGLLDKEKDFIEQEPTEIPTESVLYVIDMQNDIIDGHFSKTDFIEGVYGGEICVTAINDFITKNYKKFSKVVYTRAWHSPSHCSFGIRESKYDFKYGDTTIKNRGGKYPPHCVYNSYGADLNSEIRKMIKRDIDENGNYKYTIQIKGNDDTLVDTGIEVDIVFKGHHSDADSYGVARYDDEYLPLRQNVNGNIPFVNRPCCTYPTCKNLTGAVKLKENITGIDGKVIDIDATEKVIFKDEDEQIKQLIRQLNLEDTHKYVDTAKIDAVGKDSELSERLNEKYFTEYEYPMPGVGGNIYVVGMAGEFGVKDSAINLARLFPADQKKRKVHVIQDLTRYVFAPFFAGLQIKKLNNPTDTKQSTYYPELYRFGDHLKVTAGENGTVKFVPVDEVFLIEVNEKDVVKPLSQYIFKNDENDEDIIQRLSIPELIGDEKIEGLDQNTDKLMDPDGPYWHFASDHRPLIKDYYSNKVKIVFSNKIPKEVTDALDKDTVNDKY